VDAVTQHQIQGEGGDNGEIGDFAKVKITTQLLVAVEG
jgi:hypothetical protein